MVIGRLQINASVPNWNIRRIQKMLRLSDFKLFNQFFTPVRPSPARQLCDDITDDYVKVGNGRNKWIPNNDGCLDRAFALNRTGAKVDSFYEDGNYPSNAGFSINIIDDKAAVDRDLRCSLVGYATDGCSIYLAKLLCILTPSLDIQIKSWGIAMS